MTDAAIAVWDVIRTRHGEDAAVSRDRLIAHTGLADRKVRRAIQELRTEHGKPIAASPAGGYFVPETDDEVQAFVRPEAAKARSIFKTVAAVSTAAAAELHRELQQELFSGEHACTRRLCAYQGCDETFEVSDSRPDQMYHDRLCRWRAANERRQAS